MNTQEINKALTGVKGFKGVFSCNTLPFVKERPAAFIVNTDPSSEKGEHWVAIILANKCGEYFDSFGFCPLVPEIAQYLARFCPNGLKYSQQTLQHPYSKTCGQYCIKYIKARLDGRSYEDFLADFSFNFRANDNVLNQ
jgi:hypothetical protein